MEKTIEKKHPALNFFNKNILFSKGNQSYKVLPQMPKSQLVFFLEQAFAKRRTVILQLNNSSNATIYIEREGVIRYSPSKQNRIILEDSFRTTVYLMKIEEIRHVRLK